MAKPSKSIKVRVANVIEGGPLPPAEGANYFQFAFVAGEVQMLVGAIDLNRVHMATTGAAGHQASDEAEVTIPADISHRFLLSSFAFQQLKKNVDELSKSIEALIKESADDA